MYSCIFTGRRQRSFSPPRKVLAFRIMVETPIVTYVICMVMEDVLSMHREIQVQIFKDSQKQTARIEFPLGDLRIIASYHSHRLDLGPRAPTRSALKREVLQLKV